MRKKNSVQSDAKSGAAAVSQNPAVEVIRIAVVEDSPDFRNGLHRLFSESPGFECLSTHASAESALCALPAERPDVVLMDINLPGKDGIECVRQLKDQMPGTVFVMLTVYENNERIFQAVQAGDSGYLLKRTDSKELLRAVRDAAILNR